MNAEHSHIIYAFGIVMGGLSNDEFCGYMKNLGASDDQLTFARDALRIVARNFYQQSFGDETCQHRIIGLRLDQRGDYCRECGKLMGDYPKGKSVGALFVDERDHERDKETSGHI